jgi:hypothetical protein
MFGFVIGDSKNKKSQADSYPLEINALKSIILS